MAWGEADFEGGHVAGAVVTVGVKGSVNMITRSVGWGSSKDYNECPR